MNGKEFKRAPEEVAGADDDGNDTPPPLECETGRRSGGGRTDVCANGAVGRAAGETTKLVESCSRGDKNKLSLLTD
jgi:hypothetical protein